MWNLWFGNGGTDTDPQHQVLSVLQMPSRLRQEHQQDLTIGAVLRIADALDVPIGELIASQAG